MKVAVYNRVFENEDIPLINQIFRLFAETGARLVIYENFFRNFKPYLDEDVEASILSLFKDHGTLPADVDFMISLGGDGTMLDTVTFVGNKNIPTMGINTGRLGFLADVKSDEVEQAVNALRIGAYKTDDRSLVHLDSDTPLFGEHPYALNEFSIHRKDSSQMIKIHTFLNGEYLNTYWADGLLLSTPTGSTGYSLSCGGPIIMPQVDSFLITPVAPHNLNIRPVVVSDDHVVSFKVEGRSDNFLISLDSRSETITKDVQLAIRKEAFTFPLVRLDEHNFLKTIRQKLYWGADIRN